MQRDRVTETLAPDYNVAPTKPVYAVLSRAGRGADGPGSNRLARNDPARSGPASNAPANPGPDEAGQKLADADNKGVARELRVVRWGLVPSWAKDVAIGSRLINARAETVSEKPSFRRAFARRRCLLPADGYYEWQAVAAAATASATTGPAAGPTAGKKVKQPFFIHRADGGPLAFAGLYELWRDRAVRDGDPDAWLWTATIITTSAPDELGQIHDRMPMVIAPESWADWLDPENSDVSDLKALLAPATARGLDSYPVSTAVNSVRNNGPELIEPVEAGDRVAPLAAAAPLMGGSGGRATGADHGGAAGGDQGSAGAALL